MACPKNMRHGRLKIRSGDSTPLVKEVLYAEGDFNAEIARDLQEVEDRGVLSVHLEGQDQRVSGSFSAKFVDETLMRCLEQHVWDGQAESLTGLTGGANNADVALSYDYEQGSLAPATGESGADTKLANGATPASAGEYAEAEGTIDERDVVKVAKAAAFDVFQAAADTDLDVVYDAVGATTHSDASCSTTVKYLELIWEQLSANKQTVLKSYQLTKVVISNVQIQEGDEANTIGFQFAALDKRFTVTNGAV